MIHPNGSASNANGQHAKSARLPLPTRERWQPLRGGLLNLYRYDHEEFRYEQGHLLLRGNNGTGKSRVLALQLPFLLDGEIASHRVEPDGDPAKKMEWNLLMNRHKDRLGYSWLEFGRKDADGSEQYCTIGCGMSAVTGRGIVGKWFFVTRQRVGRDLFLQSASGPPLSRDALEQAIGDEGCVRTSAAAYRAAVDDSLFKLGEQRYGALVDLLIQLRKPQLSRQLDEAQLSDALSQALQPVPETVLADVAESFRSLESDRGELERFRRAEDGVAAFLTEYERYARIATRRRAELVRTTHSAYEHTQRGLRAAEDQLKAANAEKVRVEGVVRGLEQDEAAAQAEEQALREGPEMRNAERLARLRTDVEDLKAVAASATEERAQAQSRLDRARAVESRVAGEAAEARTALERRQVEASAAATDLGVEGQHDRAVAVDVRDSRPGRSGEAATGEIVKRRKAAAAQLRERTESVSQKREQHRVASQKHEELVGQLDEAREKERDAHAAVDAERERVAAEYAAWLRSIDELAPAGQSPDADMQARWEPDAVRLALEEWCEVGEGESAIGAAVRSMRQHALDTLATLGADNEGVRRERASRVRELEEEHERLSNGVHTPPAAPPTRAPGVRRDRPGAPLWRVCDFRSDVPDEARAGLEAALEAAGILDAWVTPDGRLLEFATGDSVLAAVNNAPVGPKHLGTILIPAVDPCDPTAVAIRDGVLEDILRRVGCEQGVGDAWVDSSGRWQLGPLHGHYVKQAAEHIGEGAREAARRRRLLDLAAEIAAAKTELERTEAEARRIDARKRRAVAEAERAPGDARVRQAIAHRSSQVAVVAALRPRVTVAEKRKLDISRELEDVLRERLEAALDLGVERWIDAVHALDLAIAAYENALTRLWSAASEQARAAVRVEEEAQRREEADAALEARTRDWNDKEKRARAATAEHETLEALVGVAAREVLDRLAGVRKSLEDIRQRKKDGEKKVVDARLAIERATVQVETQAAQLESRTEERASAIGRLSRAAVSGLLRVADPELAEDPSAWNPTRAVEVARRIETLLSGIRSDEAAWDKTQGGIHKHVQVLHDAMIEHGYPPDVTLEDDLMVVRISFRGQVLDMPQLRAALVEEITTRQAVLDAREREIIENHLIGEVAVNLHDLLHEAEDRKRAINAEIERRPTSTGMTLRFVWEPIDDGPAGFSDVRPRLLRAAATWSPAERQAVGDFLQRRIKTAREADDTSSWQEQLAKALDYRTWHRFAVERQQDGRWVRLTRRTHGTGSGGEKAIALTVPQFAAAAAHYTTAGPHAPRLILLDEAFVGVDSDMRKKCMGLLDAFDLDFAMTSEREWGCYDTLPGLAIAQLSTRPGVDAVAVTRWIWNGRQRVRDVVPVPPAAPGDHA